MVLGATAWFIAGRQKGIISSLLLGYAVFVGGVVCPTLASFVKDRLGITPQGALWAVIVGGSTAIMGKVQDGWVLKMLLTSHGRHWLQMILGPQYPSLLPIVLSVLILVGVSRLPSRDA